eukprot:gnl/TRDRNA2_/TRDRNA2_145194_c0_seq1.p1 gnl/TRDRNA2_/TRDRNA2_145194_c0~~gnl/TRDRNA2_/TRDRNA2_145194_c0_seq1.p1  ORF type:complete len:340 (-),score=24.80 gnl/TRDRNA2_/TRDRNA2_145194_c0_seq1:25-1044(-)
MVLLIAALVFADKSTLQRDVSFIAASSLHLGDSAINKIRAIAENGVHVRDLEAIICDTSFTEQSLYTTKQLESMTDSLKMKHLSEQMHKPVTCDLYMCETAKQIINDTEMVMMPDWTEKFTKRVRPLSPISKGDMDTAMLGKAKAEDRRAQSPSFGSESSISSISSLSITSLSDSSSPSSPSSASSWVPHRVGLQQQRAQNVRDRRPERPRQQRCSRNVGTRATHHSQRSNQRQAHSTCNVAPGPDVPSRIRDLVRERCITATVTEDDAARNKSCLICTDAYSAGEKLIRLPCLDAFHHHCCIRWFIQSRDDGSALRCPQCNLNLQQVAKQSRSIMRNG